MLYLSPMELRWRRRLQLVGSLALAGLLLTFVLRQVSWAELRDALAALHWPPLLAAVGLALASYGARAFRWGLILAPAGKAPLASLLGCTAAGFATSTVLPARLGELLRPLLLSSRTQLSPAATLASIVAERLLDLLTVVSLFALAWLGSGPSSGALTTSLAWAASVVASLFLALFLLVRERTRLHRWLELQARPGWRQRLVRFFQELLASLALWGNARHATFLGLWSLFTWGLAIAQVAVTARAFGLPLSPRQATLVLAISVVGLAVPTPGGVGGFHAAVQFALVQVAAWPVAAATAFALVHHAACFVPVTLLGTGYMLAVGASWQGLRPPAR